MRQARSAWLLAIASRLLMRTAAGLLGARHAAWVQAMRAEAKAIEDEHEALAFAWGCLCAAVGPALVAVRDRAGQAHPLGVWTCSATVLLGCLHMHQAGAPGAYVGKNLLSLAFAMATFRLLPLRRLQADELLRAKISFAMGAGLLVVAVGAMPTGAAAWLRFGPVSSNLTWLLLPPLLVAAEVWRLAAARRWALGGLLMAYLALALMAEVVSLGLAALVLCVLAWRGRSAALALLACATSATALCLWPRWQAPEASDFVDRVVSSGLDQGLALGLALALIQGLPLWPALRHRCARMHGLVWGLLVAISLPGWLPSPLVGFGGSFIFAYLLSLSLLPAGGAGRTAALAWRASPGRGRNPPSRLRSRLT